MKSTPGVLGQIIFMFNNEDFLVEDMSFGALQPKVSLMS